MIDWTKPLYGLSGRTARHVGELKGNPYPHIIAIEIYAGSGIEIAFNLNDDGYCEGVVAFKPIISNTEKGPE